jgi:hypothetical protein
MISVLGGPSSLVGSIGAFECPVMEERGPKAGQPSPSDFWETLSLSFNLGGGIFD